MASSGPVLFAQRGHSISPRWGQTTKVQQKPLFSKVRAFGIGVIVQVWGEELSVVSEAVVSISSSAGKRIDSKPLLSLSQFSGNTEVELTPRPKHPLRIGKEFDQASQQP